MSALSASIAELDPDQRAQWYRAIARAALDHYLEAFLTSGAIDNLAFQISILEQRTSRLFAHNMRQLAVEFCGKLIEGQPFVFI